MPKGSPRPTAGRKPLYPSGMVKVEVFMPPALRAAAESLGDGNASEGVRRALAHFADDAPPRREVQIWRWRGAHYVVLWQGAIVAACGPMPLADAQAMKRGDTPLPEQWQPEIADALDDAFWRGEMERADHAP